MVGVEEVEGGAVEGGEVDMGTSDEGKVYAVCAVGCVCGGGGGGGGGGGVKLPIFTCDHRGACHVGNNKGMVNDYCHRSFSVSRHCWA